MNEWMSEWMIRQWNKATNNDESPVECYRLIKMASIYIYFWNTFNTNEWINEWLNKWMNDSLSYFFTEWSYCLLPRLSEIKWLLNRQLETMKGSEWTGWIWERIFRWANIVEWPVGSQYHLTQFFTKNTCNLCAEQCFYLFFLHHFQTIYFQKSKSLEPPYGGVKYSVLIL